MFAYPPFPGVTWGPFVIHTWGLLVALGIIVTTLVAARRAQRAGVAPRTIWDLAFWVTLAGLLGARALYVAEYWRNFTAEPWRVVAVWEGGMSALGAVGAGVVAALWYARLYRLDFSRLAVAIAPALLLGDALGRLGGAASHMYPGRPTTFFISYPLDGVPRHEVGIELALASFVGFVVLLGVEKVWGRSRTLVRVLLWYSLERFLLDFLRAADLPTSDLRYAGLTLVQYAASGGIIIASALLMRRLDSRGF